MYFHLVDIVAFQDFGGLTQAYGLFTSPPVHNSGFGALTQVHLTLLVLKQPAFFVLITHRLRIPSGVLFGSVRIYLQFGLIWQNFLQNVVPVSF